MGKTNRPICILNTDDSMSMNSEVRITVSKLLKIVEVVHERQGGMQDTFYIYSSDLEETAKFLLQAKAWIESGFKDKSKPDSAK